MFELLNKDFLNRIKLIYSDKELETIESSFSLKKRKTVFRVNNIKSDFLEIEKELETKNLIFQKIPYLKDAYKLTEARERDLWDLDIYKNWKIYIQSVSSQIPTNLIDFEKYNQDKLKILDLTSAPWWKTSQIWANIKNNSEIIAVEKSRIRAEKMLHNFKKLWLKNIKVIIWDARYVLNDYSDNYFDIILFDAPCSWEWIINYQKEKSYKWWDLKHIKNNSLLQKEILENNIRLLKSGWEIIYSTCTLAPEENEEIVEFLLTKYNYLKIENLKEHNLIKNLDSFINIKNWIESFNWKNYKKEVKNSIRIISSKESDWFFIAKLKKIHY